MWFRNSKDLKSPEGVTLIISTFKFQLDSWRHVEVADVHTRREAEVEALFKLAVSTPSGYILVPVTTQQKKEEKKPLNRKDEYSR